MHSLLYHSSRVLQAITLLIALTIVLLGAFDELLCHTIGGYMFDEISSPGYVPPEIPIYSFHIHLLWATLFAILYAGLNWWVGPKLKARLNTADKSKMFSIVFVSLGLLIAVLGLSLDVYDYSIGYFEIRDTSIPQHGSFLGLFVFCLIFLWMLNLLFAVVIICFRYLKTLKNALFG